MRAPSVAYSVVDALPEVGRRDIAEAVGVGLDQRIGGLVPDRGVGVVLIVGNDGLVQQVIAERLVVLVLAVPACFHALVVAVVRRVRLRRLLRGCPADGMNLDDGRSCDGRGLRSDDLGVHLEAAHDGAHRGALAIGERDRHGRVIAEAHVLAHAAQRADTEYGVEFAHALVIVRVYLAAQTRAALTGRGPHAFFAGQLHARFA